MTRQVDMFTGGSPPDSTGRSCQEASGPDSRPTWTPPHDDRPPYAVAGEWDRMVRMVRARDRMRRDFGLTGIQLEVRNGPTPRLVWIKNPEIGTDL